MLVFVMCVAPPTHVRAWSMAVLLGLPPPPPPQTLVLMSNQAVTATASTAERASKSPPIKTRSEKHERLVHLLRESLSRKISEKLAANERERAAAKTEEGKEEGGGEGGEGAESPVSSVSSSGEREGGYTLYADSLDSGDESCECHMIVTWCSCDIT